MKSTYLIIGTNAAGFYAMEELKKRDKKAAIIAVNGEPYLPYKRTKINKNFQPGKLDINAFYLAPESWYKENNITLINNDTVIHIDAEHKTAELNSGTVISWEKLLFAVGAEPFIPQRPAFTEAHTLRTYDDAQRLAKLLPGGGSCLVYGLGILGVETAVNLRKEGLDVTLAGRDKDLLLRYFSPRFRRIIEKIMLNHDIPIYYEVAPEGLLLEQHSFSFKQKGINHHFDCMVHALGIVPRTELARQTGLEVQRGIIVNEYMETSVPCIFAAGDCCQLEGDTITDLWHAAQHQGQCAAANMTGVEDPYRKHIHRLKTDLFGTYCFSMRPFKTSIPSSYQSIYSSLPTEVKRIFYVSQNRIHGVEMIGDKDRAKLYQKAVEEKWDMERAEQELG